MAKKPDNTQSLPVNDRRFQEMIGELDDAYGTSTLARFNEILLLIADKTARLTIEESQVYYLGRFQENSDTELDLTPFGALKHGVSRHHAKLLMQDERLYILDLGSSNGTYVRRERLIPNVLTLLRTGDEVLLGRMRMQILFR